MVYSDEIIEKVVQKILTNLEFIQADRSSEFSSTPL